MFAYVTMWIGTQITRGHGLNLNGGNKNGTRPAFRRVTVYQVKNH